MLPTVLSIDIVRQVLCVVLGIVWQVVAKIKSAVKESVVLALHVQKNVHRIQNVQMSQHIAVICFIVYLVVP